MEKMKDVFLDDIGEILRVKKDISDKSMYILKKMHPNVIIIKEEEKELNLESTKSSLEGDNMKKYKLNQKVLCNRNRCLDAQITEILDNDYYMVKYKHISQKPYSGEDIVVEGEQKFHFSEIYETGNDTSFTIKNDWRDDFHIVSSKRYFSDFFNGYKEGYVILDVPYQRDLVWSENQKENLLTSIFNKIDIGTITFVENEDLSYEVLDGKQRFSTITDYMYDKFPYKGKYYSELSVKDRKTIKGLGLGVTIITKNRGQMTEEDKIRYFLNVNTTGTAVSEEHLEMLRNKLKEN